MAGSPVTRQIKTVPETLVGYPTVDAGKLWITSTLKIYPLVMTNIAMENGH
jgi:hypothetical protein